MNEKRFYFITTQGLMSFELTDNLPDIIKWFNDKDIGYWQRMGFNGSMLCREYLDACYYYLPPYDAELERKIQNG